jgi:cysteinyl-tRNA synthetase
MIPTLLFAAIPAGLSSTDYDGYGHGDETPDSGLDTLGASDGSFHLSASEMIQNPTISLGGGLFEDVVVSWDPPVDPTFVLNYGVYKSSEYDINGTGYAFVGEVPKGTNSIVDTGAGKSDSNTYYYRITTNTTAGSGGHPQQVAKLSRGLDTGANLISLPIVLFDTNIDSVLESIAAEYDFVRAYDASDKNDPWKLFRPGRGGDLSEIHTGTPFWVTVPSGPVSLAVPGLVPDDTVVSLEKGWNLVSLVSAGPITVATALEGIPYTDVNGFDPLQQPFGVMRLVPDEVLSPGDTFWVHLTSAADWTIAFGPTSQPPDPPPDTTPPTISSISDSPDPQISGGVVNFEAIVTDYKGVSGVSIEVFDPMGSTLGNLPMSFDAPGGKWIYDSTFTPLGTYAYTVTAKDTSDNSASASASFDIVPAPDTTPPTISSISDSPDPQISGGVVDFEAIVTDDEGVSEVSIEIFDPSDDSLGSFQMNFDAPSGKWTYSSTFTTLGIYTYFVTAKDSSDNSASASSNFEIALVPDTTPPTISSISDSPDPQISGSVVDFEAIVSDNEGVGEVWIEIFDPTGTVLGNFSMSFDAPSGKWKYSSAFTDLGIHSYTVHAKDASNNWASSSSTFGIIEGSIDAVPLPQVNYWAYQIQGINEPGVENELAASDYDMLVLDPTRTDWSSSDREFDTKGMVNRLKGTMSSDGIHRKLVIAYIDIGEAEDWRWYWKWSLGWDCLSPKPADWPDYIITCDPDGWSGNYPVAYWDVDWKDVIIYGNNQDSSPWGDYNSAIDEAIRDGFDGIYIDWVEAYEDPIVEAAAIEAGLDPAVEMVTFIAEMRAYATARNPDFIIIQQNAAQLGADHPELFDQVDAIAQESIWFDGDPSDDWSDPWGYDIPTDPSITDWYIANLDKYREAGLPVFNCEYAVDQADEAYNNSYAQGFIPYVTRRPLSQLTSTLPPDSPIDTTPGIEHYYYYRNQNILYYVPLVHPNAPTKTKIFFVIHGNGRGYDTEFNRWMNEGVSEAYNVVLISPHFDTVNFERYQRLNVGYGERADLRLIELFNKFTTWLNLTPDTFYLYGFSAGGQFTHRFVFTHPECIDRAVAGGSGTYMFPDPDVAWGYGMDLSGVEPIDMTIQLQEAYLVNMSVMVGQNDTERDSGLATNSNADAQGLNRLERARNFMDNHTAEASANGWPLIWDYQEVPDAGHTSTPVRPLAREYLFGPDDIQILPGFGNFTYNDDGDNTDRPVPVFYYRPAGFPASPPSDSKVVFAMHGSGRDAVVARDRLVHYADRYNALIVAPEFSRDYYPDADDYNRGFVKDGGGTGNLRARSDWTLMTIEELFDLVLAEIPGAPSTYSIQGNSGAGQFISRIPLLVPEARFDVAAGSNSGWYTLPDRNEPYPNGIADLDITDEDIANVYSKKVVVVVGELDTDPNSYQLKHNEWTDAQGNNRYERALFYHDHMQADAAARGVPFNWDLIVVEDVEHPAELMAHATAGAVFANATTPADMALSPIDDTYIDQSNPSDVFGSSLELRIDGGNQEIAFLKFDLGSVSAPVKVALLKFYVTNGADGPQFVHEVSDNTWTESSLTWNFAPALGMEIGMTTGGEKDGILYIEVTDYINAMIGGLVSLAIQSEDTNSLRFSSSEASMFPAQLVLFFE